MAGGRAAGSEVQGAGDEGCGKVRRGVWISSEGFGKLRKGCGQGSGLIDPSGCSVWVWSEGWGGGSGISWKPTSIVQARRCWPAPGN